MIEKIFRNKAVITSIFVVAIMCLTSTAVPVNNGQRTCDMINNYKINFDHKDVEKENIFEFYREKSDIQKSKILNTILFSLEKRCKRYFDEQFFEFPVDFLEKTEENFFSKSDLIQNFIKFKKLHNEAKSVILEDKDVSEVSFELRNLVNVFGEYIESDTENFTHHRLLDSNSDGDQDFSNYWKTFQEAEKLWGRFLNAKSFEEYWSTSETLKLAIIIVNIAFIVAGILAAVSSSWEAFFVVMCVGLAFDAAALFHYLKCRNIFLELLWYEVEISVRITHDGEGIEDLEGDEKLKALCISVTENDTIDDSYNKQFEYRLGPSEIEEDGWYTLKNRNYDYTKPPYSQPPPPPGRWKVIIKPENTWEDKIIPEFMIPAHSAYIHYNVTLNPLS